MVNCRPPALWSTFGTGPGRMWCASISVRPALAVPWLWAPMLSSDSGTFRPVSLVSLTPHYACISLRAVAPLSSGRFAFLNPFECFLGTESLVSIPLRPHWRFCRVRSTAGPSLRSLFIESLASDVLTHLPRVPRRPRPAASGAHPASLLILFRESQNFLRTVNILVSMLSQLGILNPATPHPHPREQRWQWFRWGFFSNCAGLNLRARWCLSSVAFPCSYCLWRSRGHSRICTAHTPEVVLKRVEIAQAPPPVWSQVCVRLRAVLRPAVARGPGTRVMPAHARGLCRRQGCGRPGSRPAACPQTTTAEAACPACCRVTSLNAHALNPAAPSGRDREAAGFHGCSSALVQPAVGRERMGAPRTGCPRPCCSHRTSMEHR